MNFLSFNFSRTMSFNSIILTRLVLKCSRCVQSSWVDSYSLACCCFQSEKGQNYDKIERCLQEIDQKFKSSNFFLKFSRTIELLGNFEFREFRRLREGDSRQDGGERFHHLVNVSQLRNFYIVFVIITRKFELLFAELFNFSKNFQKIFVCPREM